MPRLPLVLLVASTTLTGCFHVQLGAPARGAPLAERTAAYDGLRKQGDLHTITVSHGNHGTSVNHELDLVLANGETVRHADDILPVVDENSSAARAARRSADARAKKWTWSLGGGAAMVVGFAIAWSGLQEGLDANDNGGPDDAGRGKENLGYAIALVGGLASVIGGYYYRHVEHSARAAAFANYDDGLRARLDLCVDGMAIVDCAGAGGSPASAAR